jgi:hypothetical protein
MPSSVHHASPSSWPSPTTPTSSSRCPPEGGHHR